MRALYCHATCLSTALFPAPSRHSESPTMPPHHALQTADIVRLIFETFDSDADRRFCARAASVCRAFYDPASLVAWAKLTSFSPLWATLTDSPCSCLNTKLTEVKRVYIAEVCMPLFLSVWNSLGLSYRSCRRNRTETRRSGQHSCAAPHAYA